MAWLPFSEWLRKQRESNRHVSEYFDRRFSQYKPIYSPRNSFSYNPVSRGFRENTFSNPVSWNWGKRRIGSTIYFPNRSRDGLHWNARANDFGYQYRYPQSFSRHYRWSKSPAALVPGARYVDVPPASQPFSSAGSGQVSFARKAALRARVMSRVRAADIGSMDPPLDTPRSRTELPADVDVLDVQPNRYYEAARTAGRYAGDAGRLAAYAAGGTAAAAGAGLVGLNAVALGSHLVPEGPVTNALAYPLIAGFHGAVSAASAAHGAYTVARRWKRGRSGDLISESYPVFGPDNV